MLFLLEKNGITWKIYLYRHGADYIRLGLDNAEK